MYAHFGMVIEGKNGQNELDMLLNVFRIPSLSTIYTNITDQNDLTLKLKEYLRNLGSAYFDPFDTPTTSNFIDISKTVNVTRPFIRIQTPIIYEFIGLPMRIDELLFQAVDKTCKSCETVPSRSAWCLLCGAFLCSQTFCCMDVENGYGELNIHRRS